MANKYKKEWQFKTRWYHRTPRYWLQKDVERAEGVHDVPEMLRLDVAKGTKPNGKPPVRIFLGTEAGQYRAERVFVWSVIKSRDPARVYEIYFMKNLKGYDRTGWKTGFTNYRYGIPAMAGAKGRAIYNDVDQIYLADPGEMFDLDMKGAGSLCITERETSVMLLDCEKMSKVWTLADAQGGKKHGHFRDVVHHGGLWGKLPGEWNARDEEYSADKSKCFHFTTLQTQPWQPFPDQLRYKPHPDGEVWFALERGADAAKFTIFTREKPSRRFAEMMSRYRGLDGAMPRDFIARGRFDLHAADIGRLIAQTRAVSLMVRGASNDGENSALWPGIEVKRVDLAGPVKGAVDGAISVDELQHVPEEDIGWLLDEMFAAAKSFVYVAVPGTAITRMSPNGSDAPCTVLPAEWWQGQLERASRRHPGPRWHLVVRGEDNSLEVSRSFAGGNKLASAA